MLMVLFLIGNALNAPGIVKLYQYTPGYNLSNISSWATSGTAFKLSGPLSQYIDTMSASTSFLILVAWVVGLIGLTVWLFRRQDIVS